MSRMGRLLSPPQSCLWRSCLFQGRSALWRRRTGRERRRRLIPQRRPVGRGRGKLLRGEKWELGVISQYYIGTWLFETNLKVGSIAMSPTYHLKCIFHFITATMVQYSWWFSDGTENPEETADVPSSPRRCFGSSSSWCFSTPGSSPPSTTTSLTGWSSSRRSQTCSSSSSSL